MNKRNWFVACIVLAGLNSYASSLNEWAFEIDANGRSLNGATNSGILPPATRIPFPAGYGSTVFVTNGALRCIGQDSGTIGVWTNGAVLDSRMNPAFTSGVHYLRYDVQYSLTNDSNNSGTLLGVYFSDSAIGAPANQVAGLVLGYSPLQLATNVYPAHRVLFPLTNGLPLVGRLTAIAEVNLNSNPAALRVWYDLSDSPSFSSNAPLFQTNLTSLTTIDRLRFHATGDFRPTGSSDYADVENIRHASSWDAITQRVVDVSQPPSLTLTVSDSKNGVMEKDETNIVTVIIGNNGGSATHVTTRLSYSGPSAGFLIVSNNAPVSFSATDLVSNPDLLFTSTYALSALKDGSYLFTVQPVINGSGSGQSHKQFGLAVGARISYLTNQITEISGGTLPDKYEPGETIHIEVSSVNDGASDVTGSILNSLSADSAYFTISNLTSTTYPSLLKGAATTTTYRVTILSNTINGANSFKITNQGGGKGWTNSFQLNVFRQGIPSLSPGSISMNVLEGATATNTQVIVTNSGNASFTFSITDNGGDTIYDVTSGSGFVIGGTSLPLNDPNNNSYVSSTNNGVSSATTIGFNFPFYGTTYSNFYVTADGYIGLINSTNIPPASLDRTQALPAANGIPLIAPFWGQLNSPAGSIKTLRQSDKLVISYSGVSKVSGGATLQFQAVLFTNGWIEFRYNSAASITYAYGTNATIGIQSSTSSYTNLAITPVSGTSVRLAPKRIPWVSYSPSTGSVNPGNATNITFIANAFGKTNGASTTFNAVFNWSTGGSNTVSVSANVIAATPAYSAVSSLSFTGAAGQVIRANFVITNTGTGPLTFTITDNGAATNEYAVSNLATYNWEDISFTGTNITLIDTDSNPYITGADEGSSAMIPIGFTFPFYGGSYTKLCVSANGALRLDATGRVVSIGNLASSSSIMPAQMIAPYWDDLLLDANATLKYRSAAEQLVITWENIRQYGISGGSNQTFQAILKPSGDITFQYKKLEGIRWPYATIGLRDTPNRTSLANLVRGSNDWVVTTNVYGGVSTQYINSVSNRAVGFQSAQAQPIRYTPSSGTVPAGGTTNIIITGDARNQSVGSNVIVADATLTIAHNAAESPATLAVMFTVTNTQQSSFLRAATAEPIDRMDSDGDGITDDQERMAGTDPQNPNSSFAPTVNVTSDGPILSWEPPMDGLPRTYTLYFTTNLMGSWSYLAAVTNGTSYQDASHRNAPQIYYKMTVE